MNTTIRILLGLALVAASAGCVNLMHNSYAPLNQSEDYYDYIQPSFAEYLDATEAWLRANRTYITSDREREIALNMPFELWPEHPTDKAVLMVHGLGDSPFTFSDLANSLTSQGFYVQSLLLPGHGSKPEDLQLPSYNDWQTVVDHYANLLKQDYRKVWLAGFSTGGNLVTIHTIEHVALMG